MIRMLCALALSAALSPASGALAASFPFSFSNVEGRTDGQVSGVIVLPDGDGTFAASSVIVQSAPDALGFDEPFDAVDFGVLENEFEVSGGALVGIDFRAQGSNAAAGFFALNSQSFPLVSVLGVLGETDVEAGVLDYTSSTLSPLRTTAGQTTAPVPLPAAIAMLPAGLIGLAVVGRPRRRGAA